MKRLFIIFLSIAMFMPLYAQDEQTEDGKLNFARQHFGMGFGMGVDFANNIVSRADIFAKEIVIDFNEIEDKLGDNGGGLDTSFFWDSFLTVKNIGIGGGRWDFTFSSGVDGSISGNLPKDLFTLIAEGNSDQSVFDGEVSIWGALFAEAGIGASAKFGKLRVGVRPTLFSPLMFIPKSGINYRLDTSDGVKLTTSGDISVYSPFIEDGELKFGFDLSADGTYALFPFLDVGGSLTHIPFVPPEVQNRMRLHMVEKTVGASGQQLIDGEGLDDLDADIDFEEVYDSSVRRVFRPFRFDTFARYKPFNTELFVLTPNIGFTVDINNGEGYFNAGLEIGVNLNNLFMPYLVMGRIEGLWKHRLGFALNFRAFEVDLEASLQSQDFVSSFQMKGFGFGLGISFGW